MHEGKNLCTEGDLGRLFIPISTIIIMTSWTTLTSSYFAGIQRSIDILSRGGSSFCGA